MKKAFGRGCLELLLVWGAVSYGLYYYFSTLFTPPGPLYASIAGGMFVSWAWGTLRNIWLTVGHRRLIQNARTGIRPEDGKAFAAVGTIRALREPLLTPFQKKECVLLSYELFVKNIVSTGSGSNKSSHQTKDTFISGYGMVPCAIRTPTADIPLKGFPLLDHLPEQVVPLSSAMENVREFLGKTNFSEMGQFEIGKVMSKLGELLADDDGFVQENWKMKGKEIVLEDPDAECSERYVPTGAEVCIIGQYSATKGGLIQDISKGGLEIILGPAETAVKKLRARIVGYMIFVIIFGMLGTVGAYGVLVARERSIKTSHQ